MTAGAAPSQALPAKGNKRTDTTAAASKAAASSGIALEIEAMPTEQGNHDLVLSGGRVIDPASGTDAVLDVAVAGGRIAAVSQGPLQGRAVLDVTGRVVCPGFIDLHSHGQAIPEQRLQALDGVTTALELEAGAHPVADAYRRAAAEGRPVNYGFSTSWAVARMTVLGGADLSGQVDAFLAHAGAGWWQRPASAAEVAAIVDLLAADLAAGALGIGILVGYAPDIDPGEYLAVAALAASAGVPTYTHARNLVEVDPEVTVDGATEIVRAAAETGARMHYCHVNSTSARHVERVHDQIQRVRKEGSTVTTEAYPYGTGMTGIGAVFLSPEGLARRGLTPQAIRYAPTGERVADGARLLELRREDPAGLAFIETLREDRPDELRFVDQALRFTDAAVASDAMPIWWPNGTPPSPLLWPLPPGLVTHPRSAGTFARTLRLVRERALMPLAEAVRRATLVPATVLQPAAPAMAGKGRVQAGCDADLVVFDPDLVTDQATYTDTTRPSSGISHVLVGGTFVVRDGALVEDALPGQPVRGGS